MSDSFVPWTEEMGFGDRKRNCVGHMFDVGVCFLIEAPFWRQNPIKDPRRQPDGVLTLYEPVIPLCRGIRGEASNDFFWQVLSSAGIVWTATKYFASVM